MVYNFSQLTSPFGPLTPFAPFKKTKQKQSCVVELKTRWRHNEVQLVLNMCAVPVPRWLLGFPGFLCHPAQGKHEREYFWRLQISDIKEFLLFKSTCCDQSVFIVRNVDSCHLSFTFCKIWACLLNLSGVLMLYIYMQICAFKLFGTFVVNFKTWHKTFKYWLVMDTRGGCITLGPGFPGTPTCPCKKI